MPSDAVTSGACLTWQDENGAQHRLELTDRIFLGRVCRGIEREKCILVRNPMVSRDHAVVRLTHDGAEIVDLSKNGTWINDVRMAPGASLRLKNGDRITLGGVSFHLSCPHAILSPEKDTWAEQTCVSPKGATITNLVADIRGFSAFSQQFDSTTVYNVIETVFSRFSAIVTAHQGTVKDYIGDAIFAFWEHPDALSAEYVLPACQAAVEQFSSLPEIHRQLRERGLDLPPPMLGWGVTTGRVTLSHFGSRSADLALVGDCINLAFRLSSMASKTLQAPIVLCSQTASLVKRRLPLQDLGNHEIRGRSGHEHLFGIQVK